MENIPNYGGSFRAETLKKFAEGWSPPSIDELREAKRKSAKTGAQLAEMVGVHPRTIRKWLGGQGDIPYAAWRLWLVDIGEVLPRDVV